MTRVVLTKCPHCGDLQTAVTDKSITREPGLEPGAISFCIGCGQFALFDDRLDLRKPDEAELADIMRNEKAKKVADAWKRITEQEA